MIVGAYWSQRKESREVAAEHITSLLSTIATYSKELSTWFTKARTKAAALRSPLTLDNVVVARVLAVNRRDADRQPIPELGFSLALWNGDKASLSATVGSYSPYVLNSIMLKIDDSAALSKESYRILLEMMIRAFVPDHAVVTSNERLARAGAKKVWETGWLTYERGGELREDSFP